MLCKELLHWGDVNHIAGWSTYLPPLPSIRAGIMETLKQKAGRMELVEGPEKKKKFISKQKRKVSRGKSSSHHKFHVKKISTKWSEE